MHVSEIEQRPRQFSTQSQGTTTIVCIPFVGFFLRFRRWIMRLITGNADVIRSISIKSGKSRIPAGQSVLQQLCRIHRSSILQIDLCHIVKTCQYDGIKMSGIVCLRQRGSQVKILHGNIWRTPLIMNQTHIEQGCFGTLIQRNNEGLVIQTAGGVRFIRIKGLGHGQTDIKGFIEGQALYTNRSHPFPLRTQREDTRYTVGARDVCRHDLWRDCTHIPGKFFMRSRQDFVHLLTRLGAFRGF